MSRTPILPLKHKKINNTIFPLQQYYYYPTTLVKPSYYLKTRDWITRFQVAALEHSAGVTFTVVRPL